jgi:hypothetical protein
MKFQWYSDLKKISCAVHLAAGDPVPRFAPIAVIHACRAVDNGKGSKRSHEGVDLVAG